MLPVLSDADRHAFHPPHLVTVPGKRSLPLSFLSFANEVINKAGVSQIVRNGATVEQSMQHISHRSQNGIILFVCLGDYLVLEGVLWNGLLK